MAIRRWLHILQSVGLQVLSVSPLAAIAAPVAVAIAEAEAIGGTGDQKLQHALAAAQAAAVAAQKLGVNIDPDVVAHTAAQAISTAVLVTNIVHDAKH